MIRPRSDRVHLRRDRVDEPVVDLVTASEEGIPRLGTERRDVPQVGMDGFLDEVSEVRRELP
jgi:hypothetical protein